MKSETQDRRQHPRGDGIVTKIEDLTYTVLRKSIAANGDTIEHESVPGPRD
jgi:hypothetical protein